MWEYLPDVRKSVLSGKGSSLSFNKTTLLLFPVSVASMLHGSLITLFNPYLMDGQTDRQVQIASALLS